MWKCVSHSVMYDSAIPCTVAIELSRQEYWSGLPFPFWGDLPDPGIQTRSPALQADSLPAEPSGKQSKVVQFSSVPVMSNYLRPHEPQHAKPPCPSLTPGVYPNPCPLSRWCCPTISPSVIPLSSCPPIFLSIRNFSNESALHIRWPKYWSFSFNISPSNEDLGLISFKMDWLDLRGVQGDPIRSS